MEIKQVMEQTLQLDGQAIEIYGWIRNHRVGKNINFMMINDGTSFDTLQVVYKELDNIDVVQKFNIATAVKINGIVKLTPSGKQELEVLATSIELLAESNEDYPLQPKKHTYEFLREIAHLRTRSNTFNAVFKIRSYVSQVLHRYFEEEGFVNVHTPIITGADAEGAGEMFQVTSLDLEQINLDDNNKVEYNKDFFGKKANLTVSGQLLAETYALSFNKVYTFGPTFRAEKSNTTRHVPEFWMLEPEIAFSDLDDVIKLSQNMLIYVVEQVLTKCPKEIEFLNSLLDYDLNQRLKNLVNAKFERMTYTKAIEVLQVEVENGVKFENKVEWGIDLATEHEKHLTDQVYNAPVFITDYPKDIKAFYMRINSDQKTVAAMDLLVPGIGELIGGSQREERYDNLLAMMKEKNIDIQELQWYLDLRKYGCVKHGGFGMGFERLIMYITGMENIRDVLPFPRGVKSLEF